MVHPWQSTLPFPFPKKGRREEEEDTINILFTNQLHLDDFGTFFGFFAKNLKIL